MNKIVNANRFGRDINKIIAKYGGDVLYCGRAAKWSNFRQPRAPLANPFYNGGNPGSTLADYRRWLWEQIQNENEMVIRDLRRIRPTTTLICYCDNPSTCHCSVISKAAEWVRSERI